MAYSDLYRFSEPRRSNTHVTTERKKKANTVHKRFCLDYCQPKSKKKEKTKLEKNEVEVEEEGKIKWNTL